MTQVRGARVGRRVIAPSNVPRSTSPVSPAVQMGELIFVSGQTAGDATGVAAQARVILEKMGAILNAAGVGLADVLRCGVYLADIRTFEEMNSVYKEFFSSRPPARTTIECKMASPAVLVEIDCIAGVVMNSNAARERDAGQTWQSGLQTREEYESPSSDRTNRNK